MDDTLTTGIFIGQGATILIIIIAIVIGRYVAQVSVRKKRKGVETHLENIERRMRTYAKDQSMLLSDEKLDAIVQRALSGREGPLQKIEENMTELETLRAQHASDTEHIRLLETELAKTFQVDVSLPPMEGEDSGHGTDGTN